MTAGNTYYPGITPPSINEPARDLAGGLDDKKRAEALKQLENRPRVQKHVVPAAQHDRLDHAVLAKYPLGPAGALGLEDAPERPLDPAGGASIDGELSQRPYE